MDDIETLVARIIVAPDIVWEMSGIFERVYQSSMMQCNIVFYIQRLVSRVTLENMRSKVTIHIETFLYTLYTPEVCH